jgi:hypothetical protein
LNPPPGTPLVAKNITEWVSMCSMCNVCVCACVSTDDIRIDFSSKSDQACATSLIDLPDEVGVRPWPRTEITGETVFSVRIGPTGGKRGYTPITGRIWLVANCSKTKADCVVEVSG